MQAKPNFSESRMLDYSAVLAWWPLLQEGEWSELKWKPGQTADLNMMLLAAMEGKCGAEAVTTALGVVSTKIRSTCLLKHSHSF